MPVTRKPVVVAAVPATPADTMVVVDMEVGAVTIPEAVAGAAGTTPEETAEIAVTDLAITPVMVRRPHPDTIPTEARPRRGDLSHRTQGGLDQPDDMTWLFCQAFHTGGLRLRS